MSFFIKVYNRFHKEIDEIHEINNISYIPSLNNKGACTFTIPIKSQKFTEVNFEEENHIELYENKTCIWWGVINSVILNDPETVIGCYGYLHLLEKRKLSEKTYTNKTYGNLVMDMLNDINSVYDTGIRAGKIVGESAITDRKVNNDDYCLDKMLQYINEMNYCIEIDKNRMLNFYTSIGSDKSKYLLYWGDESSNIIKTPVVNRSSSELANCIYAESKYTENSTTYTDTGLFAENNEIVLSSVAYDEESIKKYGLKEEYIKLTDIKLQDTLDKRVKAELEKKSYPALNIELEVKNSSLCPINDLKAGDYVTLKIDDYFNLHRKIRILQIDRSVSTNTYKIIVGSMLLIPAKPQKKIYQGG